MNGLVGLIVHLYSHDYSVAAILATLITFVLISTFVLPLPVLLLTWFCRIRVLSLGIRGGTYWGTPVQMTWAEMETVEPRRILGLSYLRITSFRETCPPLWLPRYLATPKAFQEMVTEHTSPLHPLRRSLENGGTEEQRARIAH